MTRKHFELIARALADLRNETYHEMDEEEELWKRLIHHIGWACKEANPRFSFERFESRINDLCKD